MAHQALKYTNIQTHASTAHQALKYAEVKVEEKHLSSLFYRQNYFFCDFCWHVQALILRRVHHAAGRLSLFFHMLNIYRNKPSYLKLNWALVVLYC